LVTALQNLFIGGGLEEFGWRGDLLQPRPLFSGRSALFNGLFSADSGLLLSQLKDGPIQIFDLV
jgi:hypothetical protein